MNRLLLLLTLAAGALPLRAEVKPAALFQDHAVLQRNTNVPVWGTASPGERVKVTFRGQTVSATAGADGRWQVNLGPLKASAEPADLVIAGSTTNVIRDVLVGEVWLCSGQSNMEWLLSKSADATNEIAAAQHPLIRHFKVPRRIQPAPPAADVTGSWAVCSPETASNFTAVGYFFARDLQQKLKVPIGLINSSYGGSAIESWISPEALAAQPLGPVVTARWTNLVAHYPEAEAKWKTDVAAWKQEQAAAKTAGQPFTKPAPRRPGGHAEDHGLPSSLYNGMIHGLIPYALRGALWYQGESNSGRHSEYPALFDTMVNDWRSRWNRGPFPVLFVQLTDYQANWQWFREAQQQCLATTNTAMAVIVGIGETTDIHPKNKQDVGHRLARLARAKVYGEKVDCHGPLFRSAQREGSSFRITFEHAAGLTAPDNKPAEFIIAGADRKFYPATAVIDQGTVVVSAPEVPEPVAVRYAWSGPLKVNLVNAIGLPAAPFRTDDWPKD